MESLFCDVENGLNVGGNQKRGQKYAVFQRKRCI